VESTAASASSAATAAATTPGAEGAIPIALAESAVARVSVGFAARRIPARLRRARIHRLAGRPSIEAPLAIALGLWRAVSARTVALAFRGLLG
jgi:hypothetical protein